MLISIIVAIYNVDKYLDKCIESIVSQKYKDIEVILVDDGSLDASPTICDNWAKKDKRIKVIHKKNGGVSSARNAGMKIAKGEYITFVDGDDFISPSFSDAIDYVDHSEFVCCSYRFVKNKNSWIISPINNGTEVAIDDGISIDVSCGVNNSIWNKFYLRSIIKSNKICFDESLVITEDLKFNIDYFLVVKNFKFVNIPYYNYVENPHSVMSNVSYAKIENCLNVCEYAIGQLSYLEDTNAKKFIKKLISQNLLSVLKRASIYSKEENTVLQSRLKKVKKYISYGDTFIKKMVVLTTKVFGISVASKIIKLLTNKSK